MQARSGGDPEPEALESYLTWNEAIAEYFLGQKSAQKPVYLDIEGPALEECATRAGHEGDPEEGFVTAVRSTLGHGTRLLDWHSRRLRDWEASGAEEVPPFLGFLALAAYAAEWMQHREDVSATNYYVPFFELVGVADEYEAAPAAWQKGYRAHVLDLWAGLNRWLEETWEGERGLPTARSRGQNRYVSMAISQALVREADRAHLPRFFSWIGLRPGMEVDEERMERLLAGWIPTSPLSKRIKERWDVSAELREAFASVASTELETWDGMVAGGSTGSFDVRLVVQTRRRGPMRVMIAIEGSADRPPEDAEVGETAHVPRWEEQWRGTWIDLAQPPVDPLSHDVRVGGQKREWRRANVFRLEGPRWMETRYVDRESRHLVLAEGNFAAVPALLDRIAPGYRKQEDAASGWSAFHDVEVVTPVDPEDVPRPLQCLTPLTWDSMVLRGGLKYPGRPDRWHPAYPPELLVTREDGRRYDVYIEDADDRWLVAEGHGTEVIPLGELDATSGHDYRVVVEPRDAVRRMPTRTSNQPALAYKADPPPPLCRCTVGGPGRSLWAHAETEECPASPPATVDPPSELPSRPAWQLAERTPAGQESTASLQFDGQAGPGSMPASSHPPCTEGGPCYIVEPPGAKRTRGSCVYCGRSPSSEMRMRDLLERLPEITGNSGCPRGDTLTAAVIVDALGHIRGGRLDRLHRWLADLGLDGIRRHNLLADLQALGYLDVSAPSDVLTSGEPPCWHVRATMLVPHPTIEGCWLVTGLQAPTTLRELQEWAEEAGATLLERRTGADHTTPDLLIRTIEGLSRDDAEEVAEATGASLAPGVHHWVGSLPDLGASVEAIPESELPPARAPERFEPATARFRPEGAITEPGLYRLEIGYSPAYYWTPEPPRGRHLPDSRAGKVLAARASGVPAFAYMGHAIITPIGARLPGLYERAAVLASFDLPVVKHRVTAYQGVEEEVARHLYGALYTARIGDSG